MQLPGTTNYSSVAFSSETYHVNQTLEHMGGTGRKKEDKKKM